MKVGLAFSVEKWYNRSRKGGKDMLKDNSQMVLDLSPYRKEKQHEKASAGYPINGGQVGTGGHQNDSGEHL